MAEVIKNMLFGLYSLKMSDGRNGLKHALLSGI